MIEQLVSRVFYARNLAQFAHWRATGTGSYAEHMALGTFYEDIINVLDATVEAYQGAFDLVGDVPAPEDSGRDVVKLLTKHVDWLEKNRDEISRGSSAVANLVDGVTGVYLAALYKLRNLK